MDPQDNIISFYTLSNAAVSKVAFSQSERKRLQLSYEYTPATLIGYLGVHKDHKRQGFGRKTIRLALEQSYELSKLSGSAVVVVDVETTNEIAKRMYYDAAFKDFPPRKPSEEEQTKARRYDLQRLWIAMRRIPDALQILK